MMAMTLRTKDREEFNRKFVILVTEIKLVYINAHVTINIFAHFILRRFNKKILQHLTIFSNIFIFHCPPDIRPNH